MSNFKLIDNLPILDLKTELFSMLKNHEIRWGENTDQICLNSIYEDDMDIHLGCGSLYIDWDKKVVKNNAINVPKKETVLKESQFKYLCPQFKDTIFEELYNILSKHYEFGRVRFMRLIPHKCMSWHLDDTMRLHYPIKTQDGCFMIIGNEMLHLKQDTWYMTDTKIKHTALNANKEERIHLVVSIIGEK